MSDINNYKHTFKIGSQEIVLLINYKNKFWTSKVIQGETGTGGSSGGKYNSLTDYIKKQESQHRYSCSFFSKN